MPVVAQQESTTTKSFDRIRPAFQIINIFLLYIFLDHDALWARVTNFPDFTRSRGSIISSESMVSENPMPNLNPLYSLGL